MEYLAVMNVADELLLYGYEAAAAQVTIASLALMGVGT